MHPFLRAKNFLSVLTAYPELQLSLIRQQIKESVLEDLFGLIYRERVWQLPEIQINLDDRLFQEVLCLFFLIYSWLLRDARNIVLFSKPPSYSTSWIPSSRILVSDYVCYFRTYILGNTCFLQGLTQYQCPLDLISWGDLYLLIKDIRLCPARAVYPRV